MECDYSIQSDEQFLSQLSYPDGGLIPKRCTQKYILNSGLMGELVIRSQDMGIDTPSVFERLCFLKSKRVNKCLVCGSITRIQTDKSNLYRKYCSTKCWHLSDERQLLKSNRIDRETLFSLYVTQSLPCTEISKALNVSSVTVMRWLKSYDIPIRTHSNNQRIQANTTESISKRKTSVQMKYPFDRSLLNADYLREQNLHKTMSEIARDVGCSESTIHHFFNENGIRPTKHYCSQYETQLCEVLRESHIDYETNGRCYISPYELDIIVPSKNLAIEVNGLYWHSEHGSGKHPHYHLKKLEMCDTKGLRLLQFWDSEVRNKIDIIRSMILIRLGVSDTLYARKCLIRELTIEEEKRFLNNNHLQGYVPSSICYGLFHQDQLVSLMSFGRSRFSKKVEWELLRFCSLLNHQVVGGASRLFSRRPPGSIISYADRRYSVGGLYRSLGFTDFQMTSPGYSYTKDYEVLESRMKYQKHKLPDLLSDYNPHLSEWKNMKCNGFDRVWDCGQIQAIYR